MRLSRDLHDGVLQSLTGAALQLETVQRLWESEPQAARERLAAIQRLIVDEQRDLRFFIRVSKLAPLGLTDAGLNTTLRQLITRLEGLWGLRVELHLDRHDDRSFDPLAYTSASSSRKRSSMPPARGLGGPRGRRENGGVRRRRHNVAFVRGDRPRKARRASSAR
jgi:hypothetical protein